MLSDGLPTCVEVNGGAKSPGFEKRGETGERGRSRTDCGDPEDPDAGDENSVLARLARLAAVGAGDTSRSSPTARGTSVAAGTDAFCSLTRLSEAGVTGVSFSLRDGGRGLGFVFREDASNSVNVGRGRLGVEGPGRPLSCPRPVTGEICKGVLGGDVGIGGVVGGSGALENGSLEGRVLALFAWTA